MAGLRAAAAGALLWLTTESVKLQEPPAAESEVGPEDHRGINSTSTDKSLPFVSLPWDPRYCGDPHLNPLDTTLLGMITAGVPSMMANPVCRAWLSGNGNPPASEVLRLISEELLNNADYGTNCGDCRGLETPKQVLTSLAQEPRCKETHLKKNYRGVEVEVCDDSGLDETCGWHDMAKYWYHIIGWHALAVIECGVVKQLVPRTTQGMMSNFTDGKHSEWEVAGAFQCLFMTLPCLAPVQSHPVKRWKLVFPEGDLSKIEGFDCMDDCYRQPMDMYEHVKPLQINVW